jgi:hypothetical protein
MPSLAGHRKSGLVIAIVVIAIVVIAIVVIEIVVSGIRR